MADTLIPLQDLSEITSPASNDLVYITETATGNTSKKIRYNNLVPVTASSSTVFTNKTINGNNNTLTVLAASQLSGVAPVVNGGSGASSLTGILVGNGTGAFTTTTQPSGNLVGTTATQTLTNKTLTAPIIATIVNSGTLTLPTSTDTLVGRATTDTLTNKTLTSPVINVGSDAQGDVYYRNGAGLFTRLPAGASGQVLQTQGTGANPQWSNAAQTAIASSDSGSYSSGAMNYIYPCALGAPNATETLRQTSFPVAVLKSLRFYISANTLNNNIVVTVRKNAAATALTKTVATTVTGAQVITTDVSVAANDLISIQLDTTPSGSGSATITSMMLIWQIV